VGDEDGVVTHPDPPEAPKGDDEAGTAQDGKPLPPKSTTRVGRFIQTYSSFLSSFVIGVAGLCATSLWQWRQSEIARRQAESQTQLATIKSENDWRIARAEILAKNLGVLSSRGAESADQRYGVLLSLTRGAILDPELAVSYALELGKDNPAYMRSVLASTSAKNYVQLLHAFQLTCVQRFGVARDTPACKADAQAQRSAEIAQLVADEQEAAFAQHTPGPSVLLIDEQQVKAAPAKLAWLFEPYLSDLYERRQLKDLERFEQVSTGARVVAALVLATAHTGEFVTSEEAAVLDKVHQERRRWLAGYLFGRTCDGECKGRLIDAMLSVYGEAQGDYDETLRRLLLRPRAEAGAAIARLHQRLLWCQVDGDDLAEFRDHVLVPALAAALKDDKGSGKTADAPAPTAVEDVAALLAICQPPKEAPARAAYDAALDQLRKASPERYQKSFVLRRSVAERERRDPPPAMRKLTFCNAAEAATAVPLE
jgi:hypothetical protein